MCIYMEGVQVGTSVDVDLCSFADFRRVQVCKRADVQMCRSMEIDELDVKWSRILFVIRSDNVWIPCTFQTRMK